MDFSRLLPALTALPEVRICVVGDVCLDAYWSIDRTRSEESLETGLQTEPVREQRYYAGGGANVAMNLRALGVGRVMQFGVVGNDPFGGWLCRSLESAGIDTSGVLVQSTDWATQVFVKPHEDGSEQARIDLGNWNEMLGGTREALLEAVEAALPLTDFVVINEQAWRGIHTSPEFRRALLDLVRSRISGRAIIDSRHYIDEYDGLIRKLNAREAARILGEAGIPPAYMGIDELTHLSGRLVRRWHAPVALTAGDRGCIAAMEGREVHIEAVQLGGRLDPVGAGDAFLSGLSAGLAAKTDFVTAAQLGTLAAAVTVRKLHQPGTATPEEILALAGELCPP